MEQIKCIKTKERVWTYQEYLQTKWWGLFRKRFLWGLKQRHQLNCAICGNSANFNVHHRTYKNLGHEKIEDVVLLCKNCHERLHIKAREVHFFHPRRSLLAITNRCIRSTLLNKPSGYNFLRY